MTEPILRPAARVVVLDPDGAILLQRFTEGEKSWWVCPGGGLDEGEDVRAGAKREVLEELGLDDVELGPEVWRRRHVFPWRDQVLDQRERFFLMHVHARFEPRPHIGDESLWAEGIREQRWWTIEEIEESSLEFAPRRLAELLRTLRADGPPGEPFDAGV
jgi:ADP-ribose pyrophosphatase YjhB (NUDIX family)